jgi:hypothetical protein
MLSNFNIIQIFFNGIYVLKWIKKFIIISKFKFFPECPVFEYCVYMKYDLYNTNYVVP